MTGAVRVDFYQLGAIALEQVIATVSEKLLARDERLLVVAEDQALIARLDRLLWDQGPASFIPHGIAGGSEDSRQPVLLSTSADAANRARNLLIADGVWRDAAQGFNRTFYLFNSDSLDVARSAWRTLAAADNADCHYWSNEGGRWVEKASNGKHQA